jgi:hypothetical protein
MSSLQSLFTARFRAGLVLMLAASLFWNAEVKAQIDTRGGNLYGPMDETNGSLAGSDTAAASKLGETGYYNIKAGPVEMSVTAGLSTQYNSNVNLSQNNEEGDIILNPEVDLSFYYPLSDLNSLTLTLGVGYQYYIDHTDLSSFQLTPDSMLSWMVYAGDFRFTFYDNFAYQSNPTETITLANTGSYDRFTNTAGVNIDWDLNDLTLSTGYSRYSFISMESQYDYLNSYTDNTFLTASFDVMPNVKAGYTTTAAVTTYEQGGPGSLNDNWILNTGPFVKWQISEYLTLDAGAGYTHGEWASTNAAFGVADQSDLNSWYADLTLTHRINAYLNQQVAFDRSTDLGTSSNYVEVPQISYIINWLAMKDLTVTGEFMYQVGTESGGYVGEDIDRYSWGLSTSYQLTQNLSGSLAYNCIYRDSNVALRDYVQHTVTLDLRYRF